MAEVKTKGEVVLNRVAIVAVVVALIVMLTPIYWIASTAFKPRSLATTIPPTVMFEPTLTPFAKLFTKRSQLRQPVEEDVYEAAPWWEKLIYDDGEQVVKNRKTGAITSSGYWDRYKNSLIVSVASFDASAPARSSAAIQSISSEVEGRLRSSFWSRSQ